jgi:hypothetical protein
MLEVAAGAVLRLLHGQSTGDPNRGPARPTDRTIILEVFERRRRAGLTIWEVKQEAGAIRAALQTEECFNLRGTAVGTIENIIRKRHQAWRDGHPRATK